MREAGFEFTVVPPHGDESFPQAMPVSLVPKFLAEKKANGFLSGLKDEIVMTADTVVILENTILNKPADRDDAIRMLRQLSGKTHRVITAVCLLSTNKKDLFDDFTDVTFTNLTREEIEYYIDHHRPYDKAGSYGAQDWLGMIGIQRIEGSYFTVMGLPMHKVYTHLMRFVS